MITRWLLAAVHLWHGVVGCGSQPDTSSATRFARTSLGQAALVVLMVLAATAMARGYGVPGR